MAVYGALSGGFIPQDLDLDTMELFLHFFSAEELINDFQLLDLSVREVTILKAIVLREMTLRLAQQATLTDPVRAKFQAVYTALRPPTTQTK